MTTKESLPTGLSLLILNSIICMVSGITRVNHPGVSIVSAVAATALLATMKYR